MDLIKERIKRVILPALEDKELIDKCLDVLNLRDMSDETDNQEVRQLRKDLGYDLGWSLHPKNLEISFKLLDLAEKIEQGKK